MRAQLADGVLVISYVLTDDDGNPYAASAVYEIDIEFRKGSDIADFVDYVSNSPQVVHVAQKRGEQ
jgi:NADP-dependent 3-hydroxy acid dehydrogenase YdfG